MPPVVPPFMVDLLPPHLIVPMQNGQGPAWANSLFEDNAEYGFGLATGVNKNRDRIKNKMLAAMDEVKPATKEAFAAWIDVHGEHGGIQGGISKTAGSSWKVRPMPLPKRSSV